jgi:hypothetical protein
VSAPDDRPSGRQEGERRKDAVLARHESRGGALLRRARRILIEDHLRFGKATADVRDRLIRVGRCILIEDLLRFGRAADDDRDRLLRGARRVLIEDLFRFGKATADVRDGLLRRARCILIEDLLRYDKATADVRDGLLRRARRVLIEQLLRFGTATADDVADLIGLTPRGFDPRWRAAVPGPFVREGIIRDSGQVARSSRPEAHSRKVTVWQLADRQAASDWLSRNPEWPGWGPDDEPDRGFQAPTTPPAKPPAAPATATIQRRLF